MKRLYEEDSYLRKFESEIIDIDIENKLINLKETAFYGKSGGQPGDTGNIIIKANNIKIKITETFKKNGSIFHQLNTKLDFYQERFGVYQLLLPFHQPWRFGVVILCGSSWLLQSLHAPISVAV